MPTQVIPAPTKRSYGPRWQVEPVAPPAAAPAPGEARHEARQRDRVRRRLGVASVVALLAGLYLLFVVHFWSNVPYMDDWNALWLVSQGAGGHISWASLWTQHNENRMVIPNLVLIALGVASHEDLRVVMGVDVVLYVGTFVLFLQLVRRYVDRALTPLLALTTGLVWFSLADWQNALWSFQVAWFLILGLLVGMLWLLLARGMTNRVFAAAVGCAVAASFSSSQGLLLWPLGILCMLWVSPSWRRERTKLLVWVGGGALTAIAYFAGYQSVPTIPGNVVPRQLFGTVYTTLSPGFLLHHPGTGLQFLVVELGDVAPIGGRAYWPKELVGALLLTSASYVVVQSLRRRRAGERTGCLPTALIAFAACFDLTVVVNRSQLGLHLALASRYSMINLLVLVAVVIYAARYLSANSARTGAGVACAGAVAVLLVFQSITSTSYGVTQGAAFKHSLTTEARLASNMDRVAPPRKLCYQVTSLLVYGLPMPKPSYAQTLRTEGLTIFAPGASEALRKQGLPTLDGCRKR